MPKSKSTAACPLGSHIESHKYLRPYAVVWEDRTGVCIWATEAQMALDIAVMLLKRSRVDVWTVMQVTDGKVRGW